MIDIFIKDVFSKNKAELEKIKMNISEEQRETLKQSVNKLKGQVDDFIFDQNAAKKITEHDQTNSSEPLSPLREKFSTKKESYDEPEDTEDKNG